MERLRLLGSIWFSPLEFLDNLEGEEVPLGASAGFAAICAFLCGTLLFLCGAPAGLSLPPNASLLLALQVLLGPFVFGFVLLVVSRIFGSQTSTYPVAVSLAAALTGIAPVALVMQLAGAQVSPMLGLLPGIILPLLVLLILGALGLVRTLGANRTPTTVASVLLGAVILGNGLLVAAVFSRLSPDQEALVVRDRAIAQRPPPLAAPVPAPVAPAAPATWSVLINSIPPGGEVIEAPSGRSLGKAPLTVQFPRSSESVQLRLKLGDVEKLLTIEQTGDPNVVVVLQ